MVLFWLPIIPPRRAATSRHTGVPHQACGKLWRARTYRQPRAWGPRGKKIPDDWRPWSLAGLGLRLWLRSQTLRRPRPTSQATRSLDTASCWINLKMSQSRPGLHGPCGTAWRHLKTHSQVCVALLLGSFPLALASSCLFWVFLCLVVQGALGRGQRRPEGPRLCLSPWLEP